MEKLLAKIYELYGIQVHSFERMNKGFLSENYTLSDAKRRYFLKKYRFDNRERIVEIHSAKKYFADGGIPAILPIPLKSGETFFSFENGYYALFPFVDGKQFERGHLTETAIISLGEMLGHIHILGKKAALPIKEKFKIGEKEKVLEKIRRIEEKISKKTSLNRFDETALKNIALKKELISKNALKYEDLRLPSDHLTHGDYLDTNVFFGKDEKVSCVFDFEKTDYAPRTYELLRSMIYSFLSEEITTASLAKAKMYLRSYLNIYPMSKDELKRGLRLFYLKSIHIVWVENEHYLGNNTRIDEFLYSDARRTKYLSENFETLEKMLLK